MRRRPKHLQLRYRSQWLPPGQGQSLRPPAHSPPPRHGTRHNKICTRWATCSLGGSSWQHRGPYHGGTASGAADAQPARTGLPEPAAAGTAATSRTTTSMAKAHVTVLPSSIRLDQGGYDLEETTGDPRTTSHGYIPGFQLNYEIYQKGLRQQLPRRPARVQRARLPPPPWLWYCPWSRPPRLPQVWTRLKT